MSRGKKYNHVQTVENQISFEELYGEDSLVRKYIESGTLITSIQYVRLYFNGGNKFGSYYTVIPFVNDDPLDKIVFEYKDQMLNFCKRLNITKRVPYKSESS